LSLPAEGELCGECGGKDHCVRKCKCKTDRCGENVRRVKKNRNCNDYDDDNDDDFALTMKGQRHQDPYTNDATSDGGMFYCRSECWWKEDEGGIHDN